MSATAGRYFTNRLFYYAAITAVLLVMCPSLWQGTRDAFVGYSGTVVAKGNYLWVPFRSYGLVHHPRRFKWLPDKTIRWSGRLCLLRDRKLRCEEERARRIPAKARRSDASGSQGVVAAKAGTKTVGNFASNSNCLPHSERRCRINRSMQHPITSCSDNTTSRESIGMAVFNQNLNRAFVFFELTPANEISLRDR
jgi:hypothetical protein